MAKRLGVQAQHVFLQARELRQAEGEASIVAEIAEIAEMIGDALALEAERAQPNCARRNAQRQDALDRLCVRPCVGDRAIARYPAG